MTNAKQEMFKYGVLILMGALVIYMLNRTQSFDRRVQAVRRVVNPLTQKEHAHDNVSDEVKDQVRVNGKSAKDYDKDKKEKYYAQMQYSKRV